MQSLVGHKPTKSEKTKELILRKALSLFQQESYDSVTMRTLADSCDLSLGAFYYHFKSKEEVVLEFYRNSLNGHIERTREHLKLQKLRLEDVMSWVCRDRFQEFAPYRSVLRVLAQRFDPQDPISPWHASSQSIRKQSIELFEEIAVACLSCDPKTARMIARGLWLQHLMILGYWSFDRSSEDRETEEVLKQSARLWRSLPSLLRIPGTKSALNLLLSPLSRLESAI